MNFVQLTQMVSALTNKRSIVRKQYNGNRRLGLEEAVREAISWVNKRRLNFYIRTNEKNKIRPQKQAQLIFMLLEFANEEYESDDDKKSIAYQDIINICNVALLEPEVRRAFEAKATLSQEKQLFAHQNLAGIAKSIVSTTAPHQNYSVLLQFYSEGRWSPLSSMIDPRANPANNVQTLLLDQAAAAFPYSAQSLQNIGINWTIYSQYSDFAKQYIGHVKATVPNNTALINAIEPHLFDSIFVEFYNELAPNGVDKNFGDNFHNSLYRDKPAATTPTDKIQRLRDFYQRLILAKQDPANNTPLRLNAINGALGKIEALQNPAIKAICAPYAADQKAKATATAIKAFAKVQRDPKSPLSLLARELREQLKAAERADAPNPLTYSAYPGQENAKQLFQKLCAKLHEDQHSPRGGFFNSNKDPQQKKMYEDLKTLSQGNPEVKQLMREATDNVRLQYINRDLNKFLDKFYSTKWFTASKHNVDERVQLLTNTFNLNTARADNSSTKLINIYDALIKDYVDAAKKVDDKGKHVSLDGGYMKALSKTLSHTSGGMSREILAKSIAANLEVAIIRYQVKQSPGDDKVAWSNKIVADVNVIIAKLGTPDVVTGKIFTGQMAIEEIARTLAREEFLLKLHDRRFVSSHRLRDLVHNTLKELQTFLPPEYGLYIKATQAQAKVAKKGNETVSDAEYVARDVAPEYRRTP